MTCSANFRVNQKEGVYFHHQKVIISAYYSGVQQIIANGAILLQGKLILTINKMMEKISRNKTSKRIITKIIITFILLFD